MVQNRPAPTQADDEVARRAPGLPKRLPYRKADYANINFWTRKNYEDARNQNALVVIHDVAAETTNLPFMEHEDGTPLTEEEASKMRATAHGIFAQFLHDGTAPAKWGQVSVVSQDFFFNAIAERHPHAAMCEDMWKAQLLATTCYPSWHRNNKDKIERRKQEMVWIQQQLEHGRQLKEELVEHVEHVEAKLKRDRPASSANDMAQSRPSKKVKSTNSRVGLGRDGMAPALSTDSGPSRSLNNTSQHAPTLTPPSVSGALPSFNSEKPMPAPATISELSPSFNGESQLEPISTPLILPGPLPTLNFSSTSDTTPDSSGSGDDAGRLKRVRNNAEISQARTKRCWTFRVCTARRSRPDAIAEEETQATSLSAALLPADPSTQGEALAIDSAEAPSLDADAQHEMWALSLSPFSLDVSDLYGTQAAPFFTAPIPSDSYETTPSTISSLPDSLSSNEREAASPDVREAMAETLSSLRYAEPLTRPRPTPRDGPIPVTAESQDFYATFDKNYRKTTPIVRNPL